MNESEVKLHLTWSKNDWGFNEGAQEAINYINAAVAAGFGGTVSAVVGIVNNLPGVGAQIAGNSLKRPPVMDAAAALAFVLPNVAVDLALTTQAHNAPVRQGLNASRPLVEAFLRGQL